MTFANMLTIYETMKKERMSALVALEKTEKLLDLKGEAAMKPENESEHVNAIKEHSKAEAHMEEVMGAIEAIETLEIMRQQR